MRGFGEFLHARGLIGEEALDRALRNQQETIIPVGVLAVESNYLSAEQVRLIKRAQQQIDRKLGEIAMDRDWLTRDQLNELLTAQRERRVLLGEMLVRRGELSREQLDRALADYEAMHTEHNRMLNEVMSSHPLGELLRGLVDFTAKHFLRSTSEPLRVVSVAYEGGLKSAGDPAKTLFFYQSASGDLEFTFGLALDENVVLRLASHMLQEEKTEIDGMVRDVVREFLNMVVGNCFARLDRDGVSLHPAPPEVCSVEEARARVGACTRVEMVHRDGDISAVLSLDVSPSQKAES